MSGARAGCSLPDLPQRPGSVVRILTGDAFGSQASGDQHHRDTDTGLRTRTGEDHVLTPHVAGTERSGPDAGFASLFQQRWCIITPPAGVDPARLEALSDFWTSLGSKVELMDAAHHDLVLAVTSHIPHLITYTIVGTASDLEDVTQSEVIKYSAGGFRDFTRIAASDPVMWRDVFLTNKDAVLDILGRFTEELFVLQRAIRMGDGAHLHEYFTRTRAIRRGIIEAGQDTAAPDFGRVAPTSGGGGGNPA